MVKIRSGFTLIELLVVVAILFVLVALVGGVASTFLAQPVAFEAKVIDKWTDMDGDGDPVYRCRTQSVDGEVNTWNTYWVHAKISNGVYYKFTSKGAYISTVESTPQPVESTPQPVEVPR